MKDTKIEKLEELVHHYRRYFTPKKASICSGYAPMKAQSKANKLYKELQAIDSEEEKTKDWMCHCGDASTGSMKIWACNICGMQVPDEDNPDKLSEKCKQPSPLGSSAKSKISTLQQWIDEPLSDEDRKEIRDFINSSFTQPESSTEEILTVFIKEIKEEFNDQNWDYLDFIKERILKKYASQRVEREVSDEYVIRNKAIELAKECTCRHDQIVAENLIIQFAKWMKNE
jgi:hypothetical protein